jgi:guanylate kinase
LEAGKCPIVVINDVRAVEELKELFPGQVLSLFIFRRIPNISEDAVEVAKRGNVSEQEEKDRFDKAVAMYRVYIENINIFNRVILNVIDFNEDKNETDYTELQITNLLRGILTDPQILNKKNEPGPQLFILSGNAASGKDDVIKAIRKMGKLQAKILPKYTSRRASNDDGDEIVCRYIPKEKLMKKYEDAYSKESEQINKKYDAHFDVTFGDSLIEKYNSVLRDETFEDFCEVQWEINRLTELQNLKTPWQRFWEVNPDKDRFELNSEYIINLEKLCGEDNDRLVTFDKNKYVVYKNNKTIYYGFLISGVKDEMGKDKKHRVLVASHPETYKVCKSELGNNVVFIYAYSQINIDEFTKNADQEIAKLKEASYNDLKIYSKNICDFDYVIIYATTKFKDGGSGQKEELIDQMFRLFRAYK